MKAVLLTLSAIFLLAGSTVVVFASGSINSGKPVPYIGFNPDSIEFLAEQIEKSYGGDEEDWMTYSTSLARTLSQFSPGEQTELWYGPQ